MLHGGMKKPKVVNTNLEVVHGDTSAALTPEGGNEHEVIRTTRNHAKRQDRPLSGSSNAATEKGFYPGSLPVKSGSSLCRGSRARSGMTGYRASCQIEHGITPWRQGDAQLSQRSTATSRHFLPSVLVLPAFSMMKPKAFTSGLILLTSN